MKAKLLQQPQLDPETTKSQTEQEITAVSAEIQVKIEEDQEIQAEIDEDPEIKHKTANQQFNKEELEEDLVSTHPFIFDSKSQAEAELAVDWENSTEISDPDQAKVQYLDPNPATLINNPEIQSHIQTPISLIQIQRFLPDVEIREDD
ncbi:hypothetical protein PIB30_089831 [Stylosanthes scabra]|uniref:Uncharacterized protein n=1 Tax=Stylosanthes scabra TaxID=79078 RepID=A0ABU6WW20_9FABA|nr:hypothetical protein [Stylosanthes scabra]